MCNPIPMFIITLLTITNMGKRLSVHQQKNEERSYNMYTQNGILCHCEIGGPAICDDMVESRGHYVEWHKPERKNTTWFHLHV